MAKAPGQVRIIGGRFRGRKLTVPDLPGLRPTPDRVRETLFNWLMAVLPGARCLDLFAGSGALGAEALSRGAAHVDLVEQDRATAQKLQKQLSAWSETGHAVHVKEALRFLDQNTQAYDLVFLDPPYASDLLRASVDRLEQGACLQPNAWIYLEAEKSTELAFIPETWRLHRHKTAGQVGYYLYQREPASTESA